jgi:transposase
MPKKARVFSREMKLAAIRRMMAAESVGALAREFKLSPGEIIFAPEAKRIANTRRPSKSGMLAKASVVATDDLSFVRQRIDELERKVGQQQLELDFFGKPCGKSRQNTGRSTSLAQSHLRRHRSDDRCAARRAYHRALVRSISLGPCRLVSSLPGLGAAPGRDERTRCDSAHRAQEPVLRL